MARVGFRKIGPAPRGRPTLTHPSHLLSMTTKRILMSRTGDARGKRFKPLRRPPLYFLQQHGYWNRREGDSRLCPNEGGWPTPSSPHYFPIR